MLAPDSKNLLDIRMNATPQICDDPKPNERSRYPGGGVRQQRTLLLESCEDVHLSFLHAKAAARAFAETAPEADRLGVTRSFCALMLNAYWHYRCSLLGIDWNVSPCPHIEVPIDETAREIARDLGRIVSATDTLRAGYMLGTVYTTMLPADIRSSWGSFYTPPPYVERMSAGSMVV